MTPHISRERRGDVISVTSTSCLLRRKGSDPGDRQTGRVTRGLAEDKVGKARRSRWTESASSGAEVPQGLKGMLCPRLGLGA